MDATKEKSATNNDDENEITLKTGKYEWNKVPNSAEISYHTLGICRQLNSEDGILFSLILFLDVMRTK